MKNKNKRLFASIAILFMIIFGVASLSAEGVTVLEPEFRPRLPEMMAQGTSFTAISHGYGALFTNPAGFVRKGGDFTLLSTMGALRMNPFQFQEDMDALGIRSPGDDPLKMIDVFLAQLPAGIGAQTSVGFGIVGHGLGLGLISTVEADMQGDTPLGTVAPVNWTIALPLGAAMTLPLPGMKLSFGADIRPMYRLSVQTKAADLISIATGGGGLDVLWSMSALSGTGLAFDAGAILQMGTLSFGLSLRDIFGTRFDYTSASLNDVMEGSGEPTEVEDTHIIPMMARLGVAWKPKFDIFILADPVFHGEYEIPFIPLEGGELVEEPGSFFTHLNLGTEIKFFKFIALQGGLTSGYLTGGIGIDLLFIEVNFAAYTEEYGPHAGDNPGAGMSLEVALRF